MRLNLSTRPFYNERALHLLLSVLALGLAVVAAINVREVVRLSSRQTALTRAIASDEAEARALRDRAAALRAGLQQEELERILQAAREANTLIDRRTFSWTLLLNHLETTLPGDVMLTAVQPGVDRGRVTVTIAVAARSVEAVDTFVQRLEQTGAFADLVSQNETQDDSSGLLKAVVSGFYHGADAPAAGGAGPHRGEGGQT